MYNIEMDEPTEEFAECWRAAGSHIEKQADSGAISWLKSNLAPPFLEHLSFRLGNQLFFVRLVDVNGGMRTPGNPTGLIAIANGCKGHACIMPMRKIGSEWKPNEPGFGLLDARTRRPIDPIGMITDELIEMTDWELQDLAVQVVKDTIEKQGHLLMSWNSNPEVDPSIWFVGPDGSEWVVVRAVRYPEKEAVIPDNIERVRQHCARESKYGNFASVAVANADDPFAPDPKETGNFLPLYRGHGMFVSFEGLKPLP